MAFSETRASRTVLDGVCPIKIVLAEDCYAGDCLGISGGTWVLSASTDSEQPLVVAGTDGVIGDTITAYLMAVVEFTANGATTIGEVIALHDDGYLVAAGGGLPDVGFTTTLTQAILCPSAASIDTART